MRARVIVGCPVAVAVLAMSASAQGSHAVQIDMRGAFNRDVIVNGTTAGNIDETQTSVDISETSFITQGAARVLENCVEDPDGLPNKGRFAATDDHPFVDLAYDNKKGGKNARRSPGADRYKVSVPRHRYKSIHVFATTGNGESTMKVKLIYTSGSAVREFQVQDWFAPPGPGHYPLTDDRDRVYPDASTCHDDDAAAIWGFRVKAKAKRTLRAVRISRPGNDGDAVLNVFGMTGRRAGAH